MYRLLLILAAASCALTGCVERRNALHLRFDEQADVLQILHVHTHILGHDKAERDWLVKQWQWRDRLIPTVRFLGYIAYLRQSNDSYRQIDLDSPSAGDPPILKTAVPLDEIVIRPGEYFVGPDNALACTHQIDLPGKTLDTLLQLGIDATRQEWKNGIAAERERRRNGGKVFSWEECREFLLAEVESWGAAPRVETPEDRRASPDRCLSDESLSKLEAALDGKTLLRRDGSELSLSLPLIETDRGQLISIYGEVHERALARLKAREVRKELHSLIDDDFLNFLRGITLKPGMDDSLTVCCRLPRRLAVPAHPSVEPPTDAEQELQKETLKVIQAAGIPLPSSVKVTDVIARFHSGT
jgi:hypothetical protein